MNNTLTAENIKKLEEELNYRMTVKRAEIAKEKLIAASHGDRSENAEYKEACANYRRNDDRIQYLLTMISTATVIDNKNVDESLVGINTTAKIKFLEDDFETNVTLVTTMDVDLENMFISIESDLGKALYNKKIGDKVEVDAPQGKYTVEILDILSVTN
ncbi:transcription elongation factor GreA [Clostridium niameyense]|uniref:Transcription elongation factor GreA n=1 Tax=Clostridium niameyense TaxID=1622073 RepID=A0A6M0RAT1_9CLOT|nr:transcription elongation factor GreA [Clostridium niameyense]NEZ47326.1 transcription elongation factor GreA [Clostridium niameyense]